MFHSGQVNQEPILQMQQSGLSEEPAWPKAVHLSVDDFQLIETICKVLSPVRDITKMLSSEHAWLGDVVPLFSVAIDSVHNLNFASNTLRLKTELVRALSSRLKMILDTTNELPCTGGRKLSSAVPNEFAVAAYLNPRFSAAIDACYGYSERLLANEMQPIIDSGLDCAEDEVSGDAEEEEATGNTK